MKLVKYSKKYKDELVSMLSDIQDFERSIFSDREVGDKVALKWINSYKTTNSEFILIAIEANLVIGFTWCFVKKDILNKSNLKYLEISDLFIKPSFRNKGYGKIIMEEIENIGKSLKCNALTLTYLTKNEGAGRLYRRIGFKDYETSLIKKL